MVNDDIASSVRAIFDNVPLRLDPVEAAGVDALIRINLTGAAGGTYFVEIRDGAATVSNRSNGQPQLTLTLTAADYVALIQGQLNAQLAFMNGKLKITGDVGLAMKLPSLFRRA